MVWRGIGGLMLLYSALYVAQYWFSVLYDNPQRVWDVMNVVSGAGILIALVVNLWRVRSQRESHSSSRIVASPTVDPRTTERLGALALLYANGALAIWYVHNWIRLLTLEEGASTSIHHEVVWQLIAAMVPLVLATTGLRL